jgi:hypothetical protein
MPVGYGWLAGRGVGGERPGIGYALPVVTALPVMQGRGGLPESGCLAR